MKDKEKLCDILEDIGLTEKEASVYFAMLVLGTKTISEIARVSEIKRTTVYSIIESLKRQGLVVSEIKGFKTFYVAESPTKLDTLLENKKRIFENSLPDFLELYRFKGKTGFIKKYEGLESVKNIYNNILREGRPKDDYLVMANQEKWVNIAKNFFEYFIEKRSKIGMESKFLFQESDIAKHYKKFQKNWNSKIKIFPSGIILDTNIIITKDKVILQKLVEPLSAIVIEDRDIANTYREIFYVIWNSHR